METVKRKINALKDEIERKDEGKTKTPNSSPNSPNPSPKIPEIITIEVSKPYIQISRYHSPPRKAKEGTNGKGKI